jgi:murein DD-endopeptidase MepM/ murein hydrolase activator NlpD
MSYKVVPFRKKIQVLTNIALFLQVIAAVGVLAFLASLVYHAKLESEVARAQLLISLLQKERDKAYASNWSEVTHSPQEIAELVSSREIAEKINKLSNILKNTKGLKDIASSKFPGKNTSKAGVGGAEVSLRASAEELSSQQLLLQNLTTIVDLVQMLPLAIPTEAPLNSKFGSRRSPFSGDMKFHQGIDMAASYGSPVFVTGNGKVDKVSFSPTYGLCVDIRHDNSVVSRFAHLSKASVRVGQKVSRGQELGKVGATGRVTGPHLHYEIRVNEKAIDPAQLLRLTEELKKAL